MTTTSKITVGSFIVSTIVLLTVAYRSPEYLGELYWAYCLTFAGLTVSKGVVDTMQLRKKVKDIDNE